MRLDSLALLELDEKLLIEKWMQYLQYKKQYPEGTNPLTYLRNYYGYVPIDLFKNFMALDFMVTDSKRMQDDLARQKAEFENKMTKHGKDFNRL